MRPEEKARQDAVRAASTKATEVPLEVCRESVRVLGQSKVVAEKGNVNSVSDAGVSACMAHAALVGASLNVYINLSSIEEESNRNAMRQETEALRETGEKLYGEVRDLVEGKLLSG